MRIETPVPPKDESERLRSLAQTLFDVVVRQPSELTSPQKTALWDLDDLVQSELARTSGHRTSPQDLSHARSSARRKVLAGFVAVLALLAVFSTVSYRVARRFIESSQAAVQNHQPLAASDADRLSDLLIFGGLARGAVVVTALVLLLRAMALREKAEDELLRSRSAALSAAEGRRIAQTESEKSGDRLRAVLDHIDIGVFMIDLDGSMSVYNMAAERIHGAWREQMERLKQAGTHPTMFPDEKTPIPPGESPLGRALKGQIVRDAHIFMRTPFRPKGYHLNVSAVPLRDHRGLLSGAVMMFSEIGALKAPPSEK